MSTSSLAGAGEAALATASTGNDADFASAFAGSGAVFATPGTGTTATILPTAPGNAALPCDSPAPAGLLPSQGRRASSGGESLNAGRGSIRAEGAGEECLHGETVLARVNGELAADTADREVNAAGASLIVATGDELGDGSGRTAE